MRVGAILVFMAGLVVFLGGAGSAQASCVYNKAHSPIEVFFVCGSGCKNVWVIHVDDHKCRPGKSGRVSVGVMDAEATEVNWGPCHVKVDEHGWATVYQDGKTVTVKSKHKDGSVREECKIYEVKN